MLEQFVGKSEYKNCGQRVVAGQRLMQATSDIFLGWQHVSSGLDGKERDFYVRQLKDWKGSFAFEAAVPAGAAAYGKACGWTLARAHARSGDRVAIASYLGQVRHVRPGDRCLRRNLRRPERTRLQRTEGRRQLRPDHSRRQASDRPARCIAKEVVQTKGRERGSWSSSRRRASPRCWRISIARSSESLKDFKDPSQEWRRLFSELLGTFFLVLVAAGGGMMGQAFPDTISRTAAVVAPGLMVMAIILFMGKVSGAHLNPAVSVAFSLRGDFPWRRVPGLHRRAAGRRDARGAVPARGDQRLRDLRLELPGGGLLGRQRVPDGGGSDAGARQRDPRHRVRRAEHRASSARSGWAPTSRLRVSGAARSPARR